MGHTATRQPTWRGALVSPTRPAAVKAGFIAGDEPGFIDSYEPGFIALNEPGVIELNEPGATGA